MGPSRAVGAFIAVLISSALSDLARGGDLVECEPQRVTGDGRYWAYRVVDGRECWYPGRPGKPKNELVWGRGTTFSARQTVEQPQAEIETEPSEPPSRLAAAPPEKDHRGNAGGVAPSGRRPVARVHLLLAGVDARRRPAAGLAVGLATARALRAVVDCQAKTRITGCSCRRCWPSSRAQPHPPALPQWPRWRPQAPRSFGNWGDKRTSCQARRRTPVALPPMQHRPR
jgi:hypothetical protein